MTAGLPSNQHLPSALQERRAPGSADGPQIYRVVALAAIPVLAIAAGIGVAADLRVTAGAVALAVAAGTLHTRLWLPLMAMMLGGLVLLSWGFNNVAFPLGGTAVPLVDVALVYALAASFPVWWGSATTTKFGRRIVFLLCCMSVVAFVRLAFDVPRYGVIAGRDALYVLEAWAVMVGIAAGRVLNADSINRALGVLWRVAVLLALLLPLRDVLAELGPQVGVQRPTPLIQFNNSSFIAAITLFWFLQEKRRTSIFFAALSVIALLMAQSRGQFLAVALTLVAGGLLYVFTARRTSNDPGQTRVIKRVGLVVPLALVAILVLPPISGRLGEPVGVETLGAQLGTLLGEEGPGAGSLEHRADTWPKVADDVLDVPGGWLVGLGYGPDLFYGFEVEGVDVRKPHNDVLEVWARTGIVGLLPWIALLLSLGLWALRAATRFQYGWWVLALQAAMLMAALTQPAFGFAYRGMVYMLLMGLVIGMTQATRSDPSASP